MRCSVIVPVRNAASTLERAVRSALDQTPGEQVWAISEVVIAVAPSTDDSMAVAQQLAKQHPRVQVVDNPLGTIPAGLNCAIAASSGDVVVRLDAHAQLPPRYISAVVTALTRTHVAAAGGLQLAVGETPTERAVGAALMSRFGAGGAAFHLPGSKAGPTDTVYLGAFDRRVLDEVGAYDETLLTNEDYELNWRIRQAGHTIWLDPSLQVEYRPRGSATEVARQFWRYGWWKQHMLALHPGSLRLRQTIAPLLVIGLVISCLLAIFQRPWLALVVPVAYALAVIIATGANRNSLSLGERSRLLLMYPTMHLSWGLGFLVSLGSRVALRGRRT